MSEEHDAADSAAAVGLWEDFCKSLKGAAYVSTREETPTDDLERLRAGFERVARYMPALPRVWAGSVVAPAFAFLANQVVNVEFDPGSELHLGRVRS